MMLTYFPTPYPDEWWYSILSRWFVRSGFSSKTEALKDLYGCYEMKHGLLFPGPSCVHVAKRLPSDLLDIEKIVLDYTLLPYYLRFTSREKKLSTLESYITSTGSRMSRFDDLSMEGKLGPKYCPKCYEEDEKKYGEPYWHREHQVPLTPLCYKHLCRLEQPDVCWTRKLSSFFPLSSVKRSPCAWNHESWEIPLTNILCSYIQLPYMDGPNRTYNNLIWALVSKGYGAPRFLKKGALNALKLSNACSALFGDKIMERYFNTADHNLFYRTVNWSFKTPERYALLETFTGLIPQELFGPDLSLESGIGEELMALQKSGLRMTQEDVLHHLDINASQLEIVADKYNINPFWKQKYGKGERERTCCLNLSLTFEEKELVRAVATSCGSVQPSVFARKVLIDAIQAIKDGENYSTGKLDGAMKQKPAKKTHRKTIGGPAP